MRGESSSASSADPLVDGRQELRARVDELDADADLVRTDRGHTANPDRAPQTVDDQDEHLAEVGSHVGQE